MFVYGMQSNMIEKYQSIKIRLVDLLQQNTRVHVKKQQRNFTAI